MASADTITVKMVRSRIGCNPQQRKTLTALGLKRIRQERTLPNNECVRGMISSISHLVEVQD